ncbi:MAG TPA: phospho-N-acetylmuramoyl-pentapeptide-transferase, partial [bacterium]|nr:phospho-N-acetylmuramoyl-pentapeptide-transferase [bacterium]
MFYCIYEYFFDSATAAAALRVLSYITVRSGFALITAILISIIFGKKFIKKLIELKLGQPIRDDHFHKLNQVKSNTPTMGGILILFSVTVSTLLWGNLHNRYVLLSLFCLIGLGAVGFADDFLKLKYKNSRGLSGKLKLLFQILIAFAIGLYLYKSGIVSAKLWNPLQKNIEITKDTYKDLLTSDFTDKLTVPFFKNAFIPLGAAYILFVILVIIGSSNAVNLTDGLDGLAAGSSLFTLVAFTVLCYICGNWQISRYLQILFIEGSGEVTVFCSAMIGGIMGFLWFNCYPAQVFMGDTGSLSIGGVVGLLSVITKNEILLLFSGAVFVAEAVSVMLQVSYFKYTKYRFGEGKRIFKMAPIHHHFEMQGLNESKVIIRFWIISIMLLLF